RGLDAAPVERRRLDEEGDVTRLQRQGVHGLEEVAVEAVDQVGAEAAALVHGLPEVAEHLGDAVGAAGGAGGLQRLLEEAAGQELDVFGKEAEDAAHQEAGDLFGVVAAPGKGG